MTLKYVAYLCEICGKEVDDFAGIAINCCDQFMSEIPWKNNSQRVRINDFDRSEK